MSDNNVTNALIYKLDSAYFHKFMSDYYKLNNNPANFDNLFAAGVEFTAMMTTIHSSLDVLAQWINEEYNLNLNTERLSFKNIINHIDEPTLKDKLEKLRNDTTYLDDFCNYSKHRNIVKVSQVFYFLSPVQPAMFTDIESFERNGRLHPPKGLDHQLDYQFNLVISHIKDITNIDYSRTYL